MVNELDLVRTFRDDVPGPSAAAWATAKAALAVVKEEELAGAQVQGVTGPLGNAERLAGRGHRPRGRRQALARNALAAAVLALTAAAVAALLALRPGGRAEGPEVGWALAGYVRSPAGYRPSPWVAAGPGLPSAIFLLSLTCPSASTCYTQGLVAPKPGTSRPLVGVVEATEDGGKAWHLVQLGGIVPISDISCTSTAVCAMVGARTDGGPVFVRTTDGWATWVARPAPAGLSSSYQKLSHGFAVTNPIFLSCPGASGCTVVASPTTFATTDWGRTWSSSVSIEMTPTEMQCFATGECLAAAPLDATEYSTDSGRDWSFSIIPSGWPVGGWPVGGWPEFSCANPRSCVAVVGPESGLSGPSDVFFSSDGGESWSSARAQGLPTGEAFTDLACPTGSGCWLSDASLKGGPAQGAPPVLSTANGGRTWHPSRLPGALNAVLAFSCPGPSTCFALAAQLQPTSSAAPARPPALVLLVHKGPVS